MTVVASYGMVLCGNSHDIHQRYRGRIEKVKFGVPINEAFSHDIPATLLVLLLKVNKEGPLKKDIWRAPGNQAQVRKLSHIMQHGRLVNIANFSVYTAASVIKKFLSKLPGGIFGIENEQLLFNSVLSETDADKQRQVFCRIFCSLPVPSQHLLVLLFGTFRMVADGATEFGTKMTPEAIGISVAPSLFHSCIHEGQKVKVEDVQRFKLASQVVSNIIKSFGHTNLFPRECYEFYARITGRTLRVDENWLFTFQYPSRAFSQPEVVVSDVEQEYLAALQEHAADQDEEEGEETEEDNRPSSSGVELEFSSRGRGGRGRTRERGGRGLHTKLTARLSSSVGEVLSASDYGVDSCGLRCEGCSESTRSLSVLHSVHEMQQRRMECRNQWFLSPLKTGRSERSWSRESPPRTSMSLSPDPRGLLSSPEAHDTGSSREPTPAKCSYLLSDDDVPPSPEASLHRDSSFIIRRRCRQSLALRQEQFSDLLNYWRNDEHMKSIRCTDVPCECVERTPFMERNPNHSPPNSAKESSAPPSWTPPVTTAEVATPPSGNGSAVTRRRSWKTHYVRPGRQVLQMAGRSLDVDDGGGTAPPTPPLPHAHSLAGWPSSSGVGAEEGTPPSSTSSSRKRSIKKKNSNSKF